MTINNSLRLLCHIAILCLVIFATTACGSSTPIEPSTHMPTELSDAAIATTGTHHLQGIWDFVIEPEAGIVDAIPRRTLEGHYDITQLALNPQICPGCISFQFGNLAQGGRQNVIVTLKNAYTGNISGYDIKGIILADQSTDPTPPYDSPWYLLNADDYTNLGTFPISSSTRNPFKAFSPGDPQRRLAYNQSSTLTFTLMFPPSPVDMDAVSVAWALDACEVNCPEPYAIENQAVSGGIVPVLGENAQISMNVRDHQDDTATVSVDALPLGGGGAFSLTQGTGDSWSGNIYTSDDTAPGEYELEIEATDSVESTVGIWDYITVTVGLTQAQNDLYDDVKSISDDWDEDHVDCIIDELAKLLGTNSGTIQTLVEDFISDVEDLLNGPDTGDTLKWKVLKKLKELVSDLGEGGINTTMKDFIDDLRDALDSCLNGSWGWSGNSYSLSPGACTLDIGVIGGGAMSGQVLYTGNSPSCNHIRKYTSNYSGSTLYKALTNLDPMVPNFQPWPVERLDATNDGAFSWSNLSYEYYDVQEYGFMPIRISSMWCTMDNTPSFTFAPPLDDSRIFPVPVPPPDSHWKPADVCDDFDKLQYALVVDPTMFVPPHIWGLMGAPQGRDYTKLDDRYGAFFGPGMVGPDDGQIEHGPGDIAGIDAYGTSSTTARLFVLENGGQWALECFNLTDNGPGLGADGIAPVYTVPFDTQPLDVELIPTNPNYEQNPNSPTVAVLLASWDGTGYVSLHRASDGMLVQTIGTAQNGAFDHDPVYLDVNDANYDIHVIQGGPQVTIFSLSWIPE